MEDIHQIIENQVQLKVAELSSWKPVRWKGGRLYYEAKRIKKAIAKYNTATQLLYLESLLGQNYIILDTLPSCVPDVTKGFKNWLKMFIAKLKISKSKK